MVILHKQLNMFLSLAHHLFILVGEVYLVFVHFYLQKTILRKIIKSILPPVITIGFFFLSNSSLFFKLILVGVEQEGSHIMLKAYAKLTSLNQLSHLL